MYSSNANQDAASEGLLFEGTRLYQFFDCVSMSSFAFAWSRRKLSSTGEKLRIKAIFADSLSRKHNTLRPASNSAQVSFATRTGKISVWAITWRLPNRIHALTKHWGTWSPNTRLLWVTGTSNSAPCVTWLAPSSTAPWWRQGLVVRCSTGQSFVVQHLQASP